MSLKNHADLPQPVSLSQAEVEQPASNSVYILAKLAECPVEVVLVLDHQSQTIAVFVDLSVPEGTNSIFAEWAIGGASNIGQWRFVRLEDGQGTMLAPKSRSESGGE